jgi:hypothetical protein
MDWSNVKHWVKQLWVVLLSGLGCCATGTTPLLPPTVDFDKMPDIQIIGKQEAQKYGLLYAITRNEFMAFTKVDVPEDAYKLVDDIVFFREAWKCQPHPKEGCQGELRKAGPHSYDIYIKYNKCPAKTSWAHELIHLFTREYLGYADPEHETPGLFNTVNSVEERANAAAFYYGLCAETTAAGPARKVKYGTSKP